MQFETVRAFFEMGGYGFYVWLSFGVSFAAMAGLVVETRISRKKLKQHVKAEQTRRRRIAQHKAEKAAEANNKVMDT